MRIQHQGWAFTRQCGIGELQHVRTLLLGVGMFHDECIVEQALGALRASGKLRMMLRIHVNADAMDPNTKKELLNIMAMNNRHQIELWPALPREKFMKKIGEKIEIFIQPPEINLVPHAVENTIYEGIMAVWELSSARFLKGNFAYLTREQVREQYPEMFPDLNEHWLDFCRQAKGQANDNS